jgi:hypothetical protein
MRIQNKLQAKGIHDQNRCPPDYELVDIEDEPEEEY